MSASGHAVTDGRAEPGRTTIRHRYANPSFIAGIGLVLALMIGAFLVPAVSPYGPREANPIDALQGPSRSHLFGTDENGMDIFTRVFTAPRIDITIALAGVALGMLLGIALGLAAGFSRGTLSEIALRTADLVQAFPLLILATALVALAGNSLENVVWALAFVNVPIFLRLTRSRVLTVREQRYIEACTALGNSTPRLIIRHVLPNSIGPAIVQFGVSMGYAILILSGLAFLGVGVQVPTPEWGSMILSGSQNITTGQWWTVVFPGLGLVLAVFAFNLLSDGIERARVIDR